MCCLHTFTYMVENATLCHGELVRRLCCIGKARDLQARQCPSRIQDATINTACSAKSARTGRAVLLTANETILKYLRITRTATGLRVRAHLVRKRTRPASKSQMQPLNRCSEDRNVFLGPTLKSLLLSPALLPSAPALSLGGQPLSFGPTLSLLSLGAQLGELPLFFVGKFLRWPSPRVRVAFPLPRVFPSDPGLLAELRSRV